MEIYADTIPRITGFFDILPKQIKSPSGREAVEASRLLTYKFPPEIKYILYSTKGTVTAKMLSAVIAPFLYLFNTTIILLLLLL